MEAYNIVEVTLFTIKAEVDEADFLEADAAFAKELQAMPGFISRELLKGDHNRWVDIIYWESLANAQHSADTIASKSGAQPFIQMLAGTDNQMFHLTPMCNYQKTVESPL